MPLAVGDLAPLLRDPDVLVQRNAADALAKIGNSAAAQALAGSLGSPQASVNRWRWRLSKRSASRRSRP